MRACATDVQCSTVLTLMTESSLKVWVTKLFICPMVLGDTEGEGRRVEALFIASGRLETASALKEDGTFSQSTLVAKISWTSSMNHCQVQASSLISSTANAPATWLQNKTATANCEFSGEMGKRTVEMKPKESERSSAPNWPIPIQIISVPARFFRCR